MSGYPNPGGGSGGSVGTLAQVLAKGADANGVEITDAHDPTAAQSLATRAYVLANVIGVPQGVYAYNVLNSPYSATGNGSTDDYTAIQAAITAADTEAVLASPPVYLAPPSVGYLWKTGLVLKSGVQLLGAGVEGSGPQCSYGGADATHAIQFDVAPNNSRGRISGFVLNDTRSSPTSGDGIHCTTTNGLIIDNVNSRGFPGSSIYIGNTSGTPDNYNIHNVWASSQSFGVTCDHINECCVLTNIKGDSTSPRSQNMKALINLVGNPGTGYTNIVIIGAKLEVTAGSYATDLLYIDSSFHGTVTLMGGHIDGACGFIVNVQSNSCVVNVLNSGTTGSSGLLNFGTGVTGNLYSKDATTAVSANSIIGDGSTQRLIGNVAFVSAGFSAATI